MWWLSSVHGPPVAFPVGEGRKGGRDHPFVFGGYPKDYPPSWKSFPLSPLKNEKTAYILAKMSIKT